MYIVYCLQTSNQLCQCPSQDGALVPKTRSKAAALPLLAASLDVKRHLRWQHGTIWVGDDVAETSERTVLGEHVL